ncbi:MAG: acylphosphatase [Spirochaetes bacterium]|nr:acylphosphatase [Spirochaetota bacterium]
MPKELILTGKVQGVFCRKFCSDNAKKLNLKGSATNLADGSVKVIIDTDDKEKIQEFTYALKSNPYGFRFYGEIDRIDISDYTGPISGDYVF